MMIQVKLVTTGLFNLQQPSPNYLNILI